MPATSGQTTVETLSADDLAGFLELAAAEGWVATRRELDFLLAAFPAGCFAAREDGRGACAYVTALKHGQSGWIGNLLVAPDRRGQGVGEQLFTKALAALYGAGATTCWLTASAMGKRLYEKFGFAGIGVIQRWVGLGAGSGWFEGDGLFMADMIGLDRYGWGDRREALLRQCLAGGRHLADSDGFLVVQNVGGSSQLGPFSARNAAAAERLFKRALETVPVGQNIILDVPAANRVAGELLRKWGCAICGETELMRAGEQPECHLETVYGLATMGSCG